MLSRSIFSAGGIDRVVVFIVHGKRRSAFRRSAPNLSRGRLLQRGDLQIGLAAGIGRRGFSPSVSRVLQGHHAVTTSLFQHGEVVGFEG